jgi:sugar transferase (PEP-CTERM system associated)
MIRIFRHYVPKSLIAVGASEALILLASVYTGINFAFPDFNPTSELIVGGIWSKAAFYAVVMVLFMAAVGLYERGLRDDLRGLLFRIGVAFLLGLVLMAVIMRLVPILSVGNGAFTVAFVCSALGIVVFRSIIHRFGDRSLFRRRVLILGTGQSAARMQQLRRRVDRRDMMLVGYVRLSGETAMVPGDKILEANTTLLDLAAEHRVDEIVVAIDERRQHLPINEILDCKMSGIKVMEPVSFFEQQTGKIQLEGLSPSALIFADGFVQAILRSYVHRLFDLVVSALVLLVASPIMLAATLSIFMESGAPILYRQERVGRNGRRFLILKFRSMQVDAEELGKPQWAQPNDSRITRVGAFMRKVRIDELPQLFNVLRGEMSFVGPRPERPEFVQALQQEIPFYDLRHRVNPGITGWAQICYPYGASIADAREKLQYDLYYIKNYSLFLDLTILIHTAQVLLWGKGAR